MKAFDVCVQGSGPVGMSLALALGRQGLSVAWCRRPQAVQAARQDIRTYALAGSSVALLTQLKVWDALPADARTAVHRMQVMGDNAGAQLDFHDEASTRAALAWIVDAGALEDVLATALRFAPHVQAVDDEAPAALQALAEGRDAEGRRRRSVQMPQADYAQMAVANRVVADRAHEGCAWQWFRSPEVLALLPFDRPQPPRSYGVVWSVPVARAKALLALDDAGFEAELAQATHDRAGALRLAGPRAAWPLALARAEPDCGEGWVLLGDAAHVIHPLAGQGLNLGLADVRVLAETLAAREPYRALGDVRLLRRYSRRRHLPVQAMMGVTDGLWHLFAHTHPAVRELRNAGLNLVNAVPPLKRWLARTAART
jgi:2-polyprenyl-6-methoxyphenol hydroxylase-like FAD-dependent oxidoreductase